MQATCSLSRALLRSSRIATKESSRLIPFRNLNTLRRHPTFLAVRPIQRQFHSTPIQRHAGIDRPIPGTGIKVTFEDSKGTVLKMVEANEGDDILAIAHEYDVDLEGACEGSIACSTCHVILPPTIYDALPEAEDDENDMLDMAFGLTDTSRLGCQVKVTRELERLGDEEGNGEGGKGGGGIRVRLPSATRNMFVDGKKAAH